MSIDVNVTNDLVVVTESSEDITVNVSNAPGPAGQGVPIGGTAGQVLKKLSNTNYDTFWTLDGVGVPYTGATGDVNLGAFNLTATSIIKSGGTSSQFLKADGSVDSSTYQPLLTNPVTGTGATGQVAYWNGTNSQTGSNNLFWDAANARLGIGTTTPTHPINILSTNASLGFRLEHATPSSASFPFQITNSADTNYIRANVNIIELFRNGGASTIRTKGSNNELLIQSVRHLQLAVNDGTIGAQLFSTGNLILQNGGTFSDGGQRLQVYGDAFIKGSGNTSATTALTVQNSDGTVYLQFINDGRLQLGTASNNVQIFPFNTSQAPSLTSRNLMFYSPNGSQVASEGRFKFDGNGLTQTSGIVINIKSSSIFSPTSGTATYQELNVSPQINQTGGANGITRGLYVQPTLTAAADWRSIEWSNNSGFGLYGAGTANNYLAGSLGIGTTSPSASAILQADSTTKGFLPPRMTNAQRTAIGSPAVGLLVYQTDATEGTYEYISSGWRIINGGGGGGVDELQVALICQVFG